MCWQQQTLRQASRADEGSLGRALSMVLRAWSLCLFAPLPALQALCMKLWALLVTCWEQDPAAGQLACQCGPEMEDLAAAALASSQQGQQVLMVSGIEHGAVCLAWPRAPPCQGDFGVFGLAAAGL